MIYSDLTLACRKAHEIIENWDTDVFINEHHYPTGVEYSLDEKPTSTVVYHVEIGFNHKFHNTKKGRECAERYRIKFEKELNHSIFVKEIIIEKNNYHFKDGYILTTK